MTTLEHVAKKKQAEQSAEQKAAVELVRLAQEQGLSLTGPDGLLKQLTKSVLETALNEEMTEHLGYEKHDRPEAGSVNVRNGTRTKTVLTDTTGAVELDVPRDRASTFEPQIVKKCQRRLSGVDEVVLSLYAKDLTTGEISAHFAEIYGASVSKETISRITDKYSRPPWRRSDALVLKVREGGRVVTVHALVAVGVNAEGYREILGIDVTTAEDGAGWLTFWRSLTACGLSGVKLVTSDARAWPDGRDRCHARSDVAAVQNALHDQPDGGDPEVVVAVGAHAAAFGVGPARHRIRYRAIRSDH